MTVAEKNGGSRVVAQNKKAWHDYFVDERYEAGIALFGTEVKSIRNGSVNLKDSYCSFKNGELFVIGYPDMAGLDLYLFGIHCSSEEAVGNADA